MNPIEKFYNIKKQSVLEISTDKEEYISGWDKRIERLYKNNLEFHKHNLSNKSLLCKDIILNNLSFYLK